MLGEGFVRQWRFAEDEDAAGLFVETVEDGQAGPARLTVAEPIVEALACVGSWSVGVPAGWFIHHQQVLIFVEDAVGIHGKLWGDRISIGQGRGINEA